jgi:selenocysteine-specific elongation factor
VIIGTAGHIDHGKTSLVKAITGTDADRLKEEQRRGITIDLGFAYWPQPDGSSIGFVDVPGHEGYIRNMLAGVTGIGALLLVVAANEGIKPQTREHLAIAALLGITSGTVALTKTDLVDGRMVARRIEELRMLLAGTPLALADIFPVSTFSGEGLDDFKRALLSLVVKDNQSKGRPFRMPVDRAFTVKGTGTVVTGSVQAGHVQIDDRLILSPSGQEVRVRGLHAQNRVQSGAQWGDRAAINLSGLAKQDIHRGDVLVASALHRPTQMLDVSLRWAEGEGTAKSGRLSVHVHGGTGAWTGRLMPFADADGTPFGRLKLDRPAPLWGGDRLVLRDATAMRTIAGAVVLDINPPLRQYRRSDRSHLLALIARKGPLHGLPQLLATAPHAVCLEDYAADNALAPQALHPVIMAENLLHLRLGNHGYLFDPGIYLTVVRHLKQALESHHQSAPDQAGLSGQRLRLLLPHRLTSPAFLAVADHLIKRNEIAATGAMLRMPDHVPRLTAEHEALWKILRPLLSGEDRFKPPKVNELALLLRRREDTLRGLLKRLARRGDVDEVVVDHFLLRQTVADLADAAVETARASPDGWFNAASFRDKIGIGRKMTILVLEFFDRQGLTIRKADLRRIDQRNTKMFGAKIFGAEISGSRIAGSEISVPDNG